MDKRNIVVTFECFVKKDDKYIMLHRKADKRIMPDVWMAPGGHREFNEGLFEAARREIMEETGLTIKNIKIKATGNAYLKDLNEEFFFHLLIADYDSGELIQNIKDGELVWLTKEEIIKLDKVLAELKSVIPLILNDNDRVISYKATYEKGNEMSFFEIESES
ncbi:MAG: NUDIX hydrolase [Candidatus Gottesmanbacteria bacterium GW2011_GWA2_41_12]|uniref:NUDIX hydrolase n=2 Tax=Candidatus Gottesmaniibacteriota TaxID=1752720 RepID=A0A0G0XLH7_9BACT|nr:MAG: NUDIX hydrolase [Candidatus Gottesmanbacteria bacterium GW2011_GWC2_39_8]KKR88542.1 MAG: NUDIX hydrolase [Candidatus Gottesmanbacteria bacterium GW2011_GWA2_41_12]